MQVDPLAQVGDILRAVVFYAGNFILVEQQLVELGILAGAGFYVGFLHVEDAAIGDASDLVEELAALALDVIRRLGFAPRQSEHSQRHGGDAENNRVNLQEIHV